MSGLDRQLRELVVGSIRSAVRSGGDLDTMLRELGWDEIVAEDEAFAYAALFGELGAAGVPSALLDQVVLAALGIRGQATVVYPRPGAASCGRPGGTVTGLALREITADTAVVVETEQGTGVVVLPRPEVIATPLTAWEADGSVYLVELIVPAEAPLVAGDWTLARAAARRCLAHELLGLDGRMLDVAADHVRTREQFGHPLGSFQAVRHRVAEMHVQVVAGRRLADDAWRAVDAEQADQLAAAAKAYAARAHRIVSAHALQVCGAIGLTWEHPLAALVRRGFFLDALLGDERGLAGELGTLVADPDAELPAIVSAERLLAAPG